MKQNKHGGGTSILDMPDEHTRPEPPAVLVSAKEPVIPCPSCTRATRQSLTNPEDRVCTYEGLVFNASMQIVRRAGE